MGPELQAWSDAVQLGATGRTGSAWAALAPLIQLGGPVGSLAASTTASLHRQIGRHAHAHDLDDVALALVTPCDGSLLAREATLDALTGLAADAVGLGDVRTAQGRAEEANGHLCGELWRANVRIRWVRAEIALLGGDATTALEHARESVELARVAGSLRHVAKSLLFQGVCEKELGVRSETLTDAAVLALEVEALPLLWPIYSVLGDNVRASRVIEVIATDLPEDIRKEWLATPDVRRIRTLAP